MTCGRALGLTLLPAYRDTPRVRACRTFGGTLRLDSGGGNERRIGCEERRSRRPRSRQSPARGRHLMQVRGTHLQHRQCAATLRRAPPQARSVWSNDAELMARWILKHARRPFAGLRTRHRSRPRGEHLVNEGSAIVDEEVEVKSNLRRLRFRNSLERHERPSGPWSPRSIVT